VSYIRQVADFSVGRRSSWYSQQSFIETVVECLGFGRTAIGGREIAVLRILVMRQGDYEGPPEFGTWFGLVSQATLDGGFYSFEPEVPA
jgi:hypothetical protein